MTQRIPVIVIGGGIVGASCALHLNRSGYEVTVVEAGTVGHRATRLAAGAFRSQFAHPEETLLTMRSHEIRDEIQARSGVDFGFRRVGFVLLASDEAAAAELNARRGFQSDLGLDIRDLDGAELRALVPGIATDDLLATRFTPADGYARPQHVTRLLMQLAVDEGVVLREEASVVDIESDGIGQASGVALADGERLGAEIVVNASGLGAATVGRMLGTALPVGPRRQHQFFTGESAGIEPSKVPNVMERSRRLYLRGEGGGFLLSTSSADEDHRTDTDVTWPLTDSLRATLGHRWPAVADLPITDGWVGCYPITPDDRAIVGADPHMAGVFHAVGLGGHGFMHGLSTGEAVTAVVSTGSWGTIDLSPLRPDRFTSAPSGTDVA
ncbi:FAD-binding oxidoreductase [Microbacterium sp. 18062]|uniref:NAD(P)/FAD-dependent oxidoreductase n=1 Tax=Microbacterium sp. 18062 TaxID=2681410 RepID=UPI001356FE26|nr:FAD-binding oxidoreductase [Microbacterium sp. 18062]